MYFQGTKAQGRRDTIFDASGTITTGGTAQLVLPVHPSRAHLFFQNTSTSVMTLEFGSARATCAISGGAVTSGGFTVTNAGFNFTKPPIIQFDGGGKAGNASFLGLNQPGGEGPNSKLGAGRPAQALAVMTGSAPNLALSSITLIDPGAGYVIAPFVYIQNSDLDPYGCALPSATVGVLVPISGGNIWYNGTACPTDSLSVYCATTSATFTCKWMP